ncbi:urease accessory protein UreF [Pseudooceanicola onchidii]|uniref:urease accessory protein UreF n=1 Tax=Pseudooceanicola onchidii TaxID=2562279 RepID=UPI0010AA0EF7|nr:urease accessory UreF family protein [Pseudooceanicola onchidii]
MTSDPALLLHQWLSPSFPVGAFSYSHGLETAVAEGQITDAASAQAWIATALEHGAGLSDAILLAAAWRAEAGDPGALIDLARALAPSAERLVEADRMGAALARALTALHGHDLPDAPYPVVLGRAARLSDIPLPLTLRLSLQAFAANLVSACVRLVPLGQTEGQGITLALMPLIERLALQAEPGDTDLIGTSAVLLDIASMRHETLNTRLFQS